MSDTVIKIENLKKEYRLGTIGGGTLTADLQSWWARKRGKEDPNLKIGEGYGNAGDTFYALNDINLEVERGEVLGIIGHNGAGKSTLLKLLSRVTAPTEGSIKVNGRIASMLEVGTGFHPELTGRENIYMNGAILGMHHDEIEEKMEDIIAFSECRQFIDTPVKRYSSGMYVKLAFAVAAHLDAEILVMDEVLAVGDMKFQEKCLGKMGDVAGNEGKTILYVSHNMGTIKQLCSRCIVLKNGQIIYDGNVEKAISFYMGLNKNDIKRYYDFSKTVRPSIEHGVKVFIDSIEFIETDPEEELMHYQDKPYRINVLWHAKENVANIRFLFLISTLEDITIGHYQSGFICDAIVGKRYRTELLIDISPLSEGDYYTYIDIIALNDYGTHIGLDRPAEKVFFSVQKRKEYDGIVWNKKALGNVEFPRVESTNYEVDQ